MVVKMMTIVLLISKASSSATNHKIFPILLERSKAFHLRQIVSKYCKNSGEGFHQPAPPPPTLVPVPGLIELCELFYHSYFDKQGLNFTIFGS